MDVPLRLAVTDTPSEHRYADLAPLFRALGDPIRLRLLSLIAQNELVANRNTGLGSALAVLTFLTVMGISFLYIRFMGGNIRALTREEE